MNLKYLILEFNSDERTNSSDTSELMIHSWQNWYKILIYINTFPLES